MEHLDRAEASLATTVDDSGTRIVSIAGELDLSNVPAIEKALAPAARTSASRDVKRASM